MSKIIIRTVNAGGSGFTRKAESATKCHLIASGVEAEWASHVPQRNKRDDAFRREGLSRMCAAVPADEVSVGFPTLKDLTRKQYRVIADCSLVTPSLAAQVHGLHL